MKALIKFWNEIKAVPHLLKFISYLVILTLLMFSVDVLALIAHLAHVVWDVIAGIFEFSLQALFSISENKAQIITFYTLASIGLVVFYLSLILFFRNLQRQFNELQQHFKHQKFKGKIRLFLSLSAISATFILMGT